MIRELDELNSCDSRCPYFKILTNEPSEPRYVARCEAVKKNDEAYYLIDLPDSRRVKTWRTSAEVIFVGSMDKLLRNRSDPTIQAQQSMCVASEAKSI